MFQPLQIRCERAIREAEGYLELGMLDQAGEVLNALHGLRLCDGRAMYLFGEVLREKGRHHEAIVQFELAAQLLPEDVYVRLAIAWCAKRTNQLTRAINAIESALEFAPREAILHYNLACYLSIADERAAALRSLARALELDASFRDLVGSESDFDNLRGDPEFLQLTSVIV